jgi:hypothetical protein
MKLKTIEFEKKDVLINRLRLEELSENLLEEMNKQLIVYMAIKILWILKINELKKMIKEMELFFVLWLLEIVLFIWNTVKTMNNNKLYRHSPEFLCSVFGSGFLCICYGSGQFQFSLSGFRFFKKLENNGHTKF